MADKKITQLNNITGANLVDADEFVVVDISADETKAITLGELKEAFDAGSGFVRVTGDTMTGDLTVPNVITSGNVDGRDVSVDGTKLDGIEDNADVTDTTNVTASGALMDSEVTNLAQVKSFDSSDYATSAQGTLADSAVQPEDLATVATTGAYSDLTGTPTPYANSDVDNHLNVGTAITGEYLSWNGADYDWATVPAGYSDSDVDTHLNVSTATSGQVLSWTGVDYDWVDDVGGGGLFKGDNGTVGTATGAADIFRINEQTLNTNTTIDADENASATGPLAVASGVTLTVTTGGNLSIV